MERLIDEAQSIMRGVLDRLYADEYVWRMASKGVRPRRTQRLLRATTGLLWRRHPSGSTLCSIFALHRPVAPPVAQGATLLLRVGQAPRVSARARARSSRQTRSQRRLRGARPRSARCMNISDVRVSRTTRAVQLCTPARRLQDIRALRFASDRILTRVRWP